jgi:hypothetical protein
VGAFFIRVTSTYFGSLNFSNYIRFSQISLVLSLTTLLFYNDILRFRILVLETFTHQILSIYLLTHERISPVFFMVLIF